jgi:hypothetical protein
VFCVCGGFDGKPECFSDNPECFVYAVVLIATRSVLVTNQECFVYAVVPIANRSVLVKIWSVFCMLWFRLQTGMF